MIPKQPQDTVMSFGEHLDELRRRLIHTLLGLAPIFFLSLLVGDRLLGWMIIPVEQSLRSADMTVMLQGTSPLETFSAYLKVSLIAAIIVGSPWVLYQAWLFVAPGLYARERRFAYFLLPLSVVLTLAGTYFLFRVILPVMLAFFAGFGSGIGVRPIETAPIPSNIVLPTLPVLAADPPNPAPGQAWVNSALHKMRVAVAEGKVLSVELHGDAVIAQHYKISEYVNLVFLMTLAFALAFQTPVVVLLLGWVGILRIETLRHYRKYALFLAFVAGAIISPSPDPFSMILLAVPLYLLYELGGILLRFIPASRVAEGFWTPASRARRSRAPDRPRARFAPPADPHEPDHGRANGVGGRTVPASDPRAVPAAPHPPEVAPDEDPPRGNG
ncbi:MAG: twin-arginine translocase subunit TatC [Phycisphaerae bacterium]|nr:twin-arginine translocase subunit TatC [Phycisphaerae bacterium]